jgi:hypothetical protein
MTFRYRGGEQTELRFDADMLGVPQRCSTVVRHVEYPGEVIVVERPDPDLGRPLEGDTCFRFVLFTTPRRIPAGQIHDPRIAMAVPRRSPDRTEEDMSREIRLIREAKVRYVVGGAADTAALRRSLEEQEATLRGQLSRREGVSYLHGRVYTHPSVTVRPDQVFTEPDTASWVQAMVEVLITQAFPDLPFDHQGLPGVVDEDVVLRLFRGLIQGQETEAETVKAFAPHLDLSRPETPQELDAANSPGATVLGPPFEAKGGRMAVAEAIELLMSGHGFPRTLAALYMIVFVQDARAELGLVEGHSIVSTEGRTLESDRITWDILPDVEFTSALLEQLTEIRTESEASWNTVAPYAVFLDSSLVATTDRRQISVQDRRLRSALDELDARVSNVIARLQAIADVLGTEIDEQTASGMDDLQALSRTTRVEAFRVCFSRTFRKAVGA